MTTQAPSEATRPISFFLNDQLVQVGGIDVTTTLLNWLRRDRRLTGTKEGCAEGDCGACTVVVGEMADDTVHYRAMNACILFLPTLDGKIVLTVEALANTDGGLHPVQEAMVDCHGAQCGFCTPGIVMSLYAEYLGGEKSSDDGVNDVLAGNLCRCTGYGPVVAAAHQACQGPRPEWDIGRRRQDAARLQQLAHTPDLSLQDGDQSFTAPTSMAALASTLAKKPDSRIVSGSTDVGLWVTKQHRRLGDIVYTGRVPELKVLETTGATLRVGAGVTLNEAAKALGVRWPDLGELIRRFASVQIRNSATVGGNIANGSPIGDLPPALIALGAKLVLRLGAQRRTVPLESFFIDYGKQDRHPGELVEAIEIDEPPHDRLRCYKISKRFDQDISAVCGCFLVQVENGHVTQARIAFGGMAGTPKRARAVEAALCNQPWSLTTIEAACQLFAADFQPITDMRSTADYRLMVARNLLVKYFHELSQTHVATRLVGARRALA